MKRCPECFNMQPDYATWCHDCGEPLDPADEPTGDPVPPPEMLVRDVRQAGAIDNPAFDTSKGEEAS